MGYSFMGYASPESSQHITYIWLPNRAQFLYLAKVDAPLVKREKNLRCSVCLFAELSSNWNTNI